MPNFVWLLFVAVVVVAIAQYIPAPFRIVCWLLAVLLVLYAVFQLIS